VTEQLKEVQSLRRMPVRKVEPKETNLEAHFGSN
jgi:hypothetical protein